MQLIERKENEDIPYKRAAKGHRVLSGYVTLLWGGGYLWGGRFNQARAAKRSAGVIPPP